MKRLKVGDYVREVDGKAVGIIVHIMRHADLVVVNWPPSQHGAYPRHGSEQPETMGESRIGCNDLDQALVEQVDVGGKPSDAAPGGGPDQIRWPVRQIAHRRGSRAI